MKAPVKLQYYRNMDQPKPIKISYVTKECSYCADKMQVALVRHKRPVPAGAKDLNLYDEITCWQCQNCGYTSSDLLSPCPCCKQVSIEGVDIGVDNSAPDPNSYTQSMLPLPVRLALQRQLSHKKNGDSYVSMHTGCSNCTECIYCKQPLKTYDIEIWHPDFSNSVRYQYSHPSCREKRVLYVEEQQKKHAQEAEIKKRQMYTSKLEARKNSGCCICCGGSFRLFEKKVKHTSEAYGVSGIAHQKCAIRGTIRISP